MSDLGRLVVSLQANVAQFQADMGKAAYVAEKSMAQISAAARGAQTMLVGLGAVTAGLVAAGWVKDVVAAASALDDLADSTGSAVEDLSRLANVAKIGGVQFDTLATSLNKLAANLAGADEEAGKAGKALAFLGVQSRDPATALQEVADKLAQYADGAGKAALARDLFGKNGPAFLAYLKDLAQAHDVAGTFTAQQAAEAEKLEKALRSLTVQSSMFRTALLSEVVPAINEIIAKFKAAREAGLGFFASSAISLANDTGIENRIRTVSSEIDRLNKQLAAGEREGFGAWVRDAVEKLKPLRAELNVLLGLKAQIELGQNADRFDRFLGGEQGAPTGTFKPVTYRSAPATDGGKKKVDEFTAALEEMAKAAALADRELAALFDNEELTAADRALAQLMSTERWKKFTDEQRETIKARAAETAAVQRQTEQWKRSAKEAADFAEQRKRASEADAEAIARSAAATRELVERLELEAKTIGMTNEARERAIALKQVEDDWNRGLIESEDQYLERIRAVNEAFDRRDEALRADRLRNTLHDHVTEWTNAYEEISDNIADALMRGFESGKDFVQNLRDTIVNAFQTMVLRPVIRAVFAGLPGVAGASDGSGGFGLGNLLGGLGNPFGAGFSWRGNSWGGGVLSPEGGLPFFGTGDYLGQALAGAGIGFAGGSLISTLMPERRQQGTQIGGTIGGAVGSIFGPIGSLIGSALGSLVGSLFKTGGGPKTGGSATNIEGFGRLFTPDQRDAELQQLVGLQAAAYRDVLRRLGGRGRAGFAFGFDMDPQGTADSRVSAAATVNGRQVYSVADLGAGRDEASLKAALDLEAKRAMLAALQASALPGEVARILNLVAASGASAADIDGIVAFADALKSVVDALAGVGDLDKTIAELSQSTFDAFRAQGEAFRALLDDFDGSTQATTELGQATAEYYDSLVRLVAQIRQLKRDIDAMFAGTRESIFLSNRTPEFVNAYLQQQAADLFAALPSMTDPQAIADAAARFNQFIGQAFNLRTPEQQIADRDAFIASIERFNAAVQARLAELEGMGVSEGRSLLERASDAINAAADKFAGAADTQVVAGTLQLTAAQTPLQVVVTIPGLGAEVG